MKYILFIAFLFPLLCSAQDNTIISGTSGGSGSEEIAPCEESDTLNYLNAYSSNDDCGGFVAYASGTYTPTITNRYGITSTTAGTFTYLRIGSAVTVCGSVALTDSSSASVSWVFKLSLPITSDFTLLDDAVGCGTASIGSSPYVTATTPVALFAQPSTDLIYCTGTTNTNSSQYVNITCTYKVK